MGRRRETMSDGDRACPRLLWKAGWLIRSQPRSGRRGWWWRGGKIAAIEAGAGRGPYILPGFVDAHIHVESSMLVPTEFARLAVRHGTVATVSDPHEIANVLGVAGVRYMVANARQTPLKIWFGAPSCVPATGFETAGGAVSAEEIEDLLKSGECHYLSEVMNYPEVLAGEAVVCEKIAVARAVGAAGGWACAGGAWRGSAALFCGGDCDGP